MSATDYKLPTNLQAFQQTKINQQNYVKEIKIVVIGDSGCGKTSLLINFKDNKPASYEDYIPTIFETYNCFVSNNNGGQIFKLSLHDTAGQEDFEGLRIPIYSDVDIVIACYSVDSQPSLANIQESWIPEVQNYQPDVPIVLVGTKCDLKNQLSSDQLVSESDELLVCNSIGSNVVGHLQASAVTTENVHKVFDVCVSQIANKLNSQSNTTTTNNTVSKQQQQQSKINSSSNKTPIQNSNSESESGCCIIT
ncbi:hypothetical protein CANARDRAFT_175268 [[Candida] arabinofermentans NRRL YB-2248]|uniref:Uncharacterized protein n=1 Tax=[Candida] arabinofermentans NRRL YB-2248 TaxID=983967 RepID=A0A1E4T3R5_9ASCO|nr:hypothetical protein CANARDRAFT_175268 [[Candida] arabinofermentans NRRL YB-2248]